MRIVSLNAWCGVLLDELLAWLPTVGADVLCLQEVTSTVEHQGWVTYADGARTLDQRSDLVADVRQVLPEHQLHFHFHFHVHDTGPVLRQDGRVHRQQFGIATLIAPRLAVVGSAAKHVHGGFTHREQWPAEDRGRVAHAVRVAEGSRTVTVAHTHGVRLASGKGDFPAGREQAQRLVELVERVREPGDVTVVAGDLNVLPGSETLRVLAESGLVDLVGDADTRTSRYAKPVRSASYVLVSDPATVRSFEVIAAPEVSDHRPLVLDLTSG